MMKLMKAKHPPWYQWVFWGLCLVYMVCLSYTLWTAFYAPVYNDEVQWKMTVSRLFLDGGKVINLFPACSQGFLLNSPWTWYPARILDALIYADASNPFYLRQYGWFSYLGLLLLWSAMCHLCTRLSWTISLLWISAFFMVGTMPFLMVWSRPEQPIMIWITLGLLLGMYFYKNPPQTTSLKVFAFILFALIGCCLSASHAKGVYFLPLLLVLWFRIVQGFWLTVLMGAIYLWSFIETFMLWKARTTCAESEWWTNMVLSFTVQPKLLIQSPRQFFEMGANNILRWFDYVRGASFELGFYNPFLRLENSQSWIDQFALQAFGFSIYAASFLMALNILQELITLYQRGYRSWAIAIAAYVVLIAILLSTPFAWVGILILGLGLSTLLLLLLWNKGRSQWSITITLGICLMVLMFTQILKNYYEASLVWPIWLLICIFSFTATSRWSRVMLLYMVLPLMLLVAIASTQLRWDLIGLLPFEWQKARLERVMDNERFKEFAKEACGIIESKGSMVLDDETYPIFWRHPKPIFTAYLYGWYAQGTDYRKTLMLQKPRGLATNCNSAPPELSPYLKKTKHFCCASKESLEDFNSNTLKNLTLKNN